MENITGDEDFMGLVQLVASDKNFFCPQLLVKRSVCLCNRA